MAATLPAGTGGGPHLRDVLTSASAALAGEPNRLGLPRLSHAAVVLVDGLGAAALAARAGHARFLAPRAAKRSIATGALTTTAAAIPSLTTGTDPGTHGLVGYTALDPASGSVVNLLHAFDDGALPVSWQRSPTLFERAGDGVDPVVVGAPQYASSGFTRAALRGARYLPARSLAERCGALVDAMHGGAPVLGYLYVAELDVAAHAHGWQSERWLQALETLDAAVAELTAALPRGAGVLLTADHGIIDVAPRDHLAYDQLPGLLDAVRQVAGEARCLQLHLVDGADAAAVARMWSDALGDRAWVATRADAIDAGWFGSVDAAVLPRIGEVLVAARGRTALIDSRAGADRMIGHHGSWTDEERRVPLVRLGAAER